jgi:hypothetical protein
MSPKLVEDENIPMNNPLAALGNHRDRITKKDAQQGDYKIPSANLIPISSQNR